MAKFLKVTDAYNITHLINHESIKEIVEDDKPAKGEEGVYIRLVDGTQLYTDDGINDIEKALK